MIFIIYWLFITDLHCIFLNLAIQCYTVQCCPSQEELSHFSLFCIPLTLSLIPLSLVVMGNVRLSHVWGFYWDLDEGMINERVRKSRNRTHTFAPAVSDAHPRTHQLYCSYNTLSSFSPLCLSLTLSFSLVTKRHLQTNPEKSSQLSF